MFSAAPCKHILLPPFFVSVSTHTFQHFPPNLLGCSKFWNTTRRRQFLVGWMKHFELLHSFNAASATCFLCFCLWPALLLITWSAVLQGTLTRLKLLKNPSYFIEPEDSSPHSQQPDMHRIRPIPRPLWLVRNIVLFLWWEVVSTSPNPSWMTTPCRLSASAYCIYSQLPSIPGGSAMPWCQGPTNRAGTSVDIHLNAIH